MQEKKPPSRAQEIEQMRRDLRDHSQSHPLLQKKTLLNAVEVLESNHIPYALIGGIAGKELGRPRITHDIDLFIRPEDANYALDMLKKAQFKTEKRDPAWLYKAWKNETLVDLIFKSHGDIYFDEEILHNVRRVKYDGHFLNCISPEDFVVIKAAVHQEHIPHHWHDALAVLTEGDLNWNYLINKAKHSPRRVLSLLIYAQSNDIAIPSEAIGALYKKVYTPSSHESRGLHHPYRSKEQQGEGKNASKDSFIYTKGKIIEELSTDIRTADHDIKVYVGESFVEARGEVFTQGQMNAVSEIIGKVAPEFEFRNLVHVRDVCAPDESEVIQ